MDYQNALQLPIRRQSDALHYFPLCNHNGFLITEKKLEIIEMRVLIFKKNPMVPHIEMNRVLTKIQSDQ